MYLCDDLGSTSSILFLCLFFLIFNNIVGILNLGPNLFWISAKLSSNLTS